MTSCVAVEIGSSAVRFGALVADRDEAPRYWSYGAHIASGESLDQALTRVANNFYCLSGFRPGNEDLVLLSGGTDLHLALPTRIGETVKVAQSMNCLVPLISGQVLPASQLVFGGGSAQGIISLLEATTIGWAYTGSKIFMVPGYIIDCGVDHTIMVPVKPNDDIAQLLRSSCPAKMWAVGWNTPIAAGSGLVAAMDSSDKSSPGIGMVRTLVKGGLSNDIKGAVVAYLGRLVGNDTVPSTVLTEVAASLYSASVNRLVRKFRDTGVNNSTPVALTGPGAPFVSDALSAYGIAKGNATQLLATPTINPPPVNWSLFGMALYGWEHLLRKQKVEVSLTYAK